MNVSGSLSTRHLHRPTRSARAFGVLCAVLMFVAVAPARGEPEEEEDATARELSSVLLARFAEDPAALAPIGLPDASTLPKWGWSVSYRYSKLHFDRLRKNTNHVSVNEALLEYGEAPRRRDLQIHRVGLAFAPHERVTLAVALPVILNRTHMITASREKFATETEGVGDLELRVLVPFMRNGTQTLQIEMGLTAPTGSISEHDRNGIGESEWLSFQQQLGSGTVDLLPGFVYRGSSEYLSWGLHGRGVFRIYKNSKGYRGGDHYSLSTWVAHSFTDWMSGSVRLGWERRQNIHGADETMQNPELHPKRHGGELIELGPGVNFKLPFDRAPRFGVEMSWPIWETVSGPQFERDWKLTAGWKWEL